MLSSASVTVSYRDDKVTRDTKNIEIFHQENVELDKNLDHGTMHLSDLSNICYRMIAKQHINISHDLLLCISIIPGIFIVKL